MFIAILMKNQPLHKILIVYKKSKYELDCEKYAPETLKKIWKIQNDCEDRIYSSHLRQIESRRILREEIFPESIFISREEIVHYKPEDFDLIIALGGDNHFTYISHFAMQTLILGCNSDPQTSAGELLAFIPSTLAKTAASGWENTKIAEWTLISGEIHYPDGKVLKTYSSVSEVTVRNKCPDLISRFIIEYNGKSEEQKCSGLLVYTGAGSTGWIFSITNDPGVIFGKQDDYFVVYSREIRNRATRQLAHFRVSDSVTIISEMDGGISIDALQERVYDFPPGARLVLKLSREKLRVITLNAE